MFSIIFEISNIAFITANRNHDAAGNFHRRTDFKFV